MALKIPNTPKKQKQDITISSTEAPEPLKANDKEILLEAVNKQIEMELHTEKMYWSIAIWAAHKGLTGTYKFFYKRAEEERKHATDFVNIALLCDKQPTLAFNLPEDVIKYDDLQSVLNSVYEQEQLVTKSIFELKQLATNKGNAKLMRLASKYLNEQVEEEAWALSLVKLAEKAKDNLYDFDLAIEELLEDGDHMLPKPSVFE